MPEERISVAADRIIARVLASHAPGDERDELVSVIKHMADEVAEWDRRTGTTTWWKWPFPGGA